MNALDKVLAALNTFDAAAMEHGWERDQGSEIAAKKSAKKYQAAKTRLRNLIVEAIEGPKS